MDVKTELRLAFVSGNLENVQRILDQESPVINGDVGPDGARDYGGNLLAIALNSNPTPDMINLVFRNGAQVVNDAVNPDGTRNYGFDTLALALSRNLPSEIIKLLFKNGAQVVNDAVGPDGTSSYENNTLAFYLRRPHSAEVVELLFRKGASVVNEARNLDGSISYENNTLQLAISNGSSLDVIAVLLQNGADINSVNADHPRREEIIEFRESLVLEEKKRNDIYKTLGEFRASKSIPDAIPSLIGRIVDYLVTDHFNDSAEVLESIKAKDSNISKMLENRHSREKIVPSTVAGEVDEEIQVEKKEEASPSVSPTSSEQLDKESNEKGGGKFGK